MSVYEGDEFKCPNGSKNYLCTHCCVFIICCELFLEIVLAYNFKAPISMTYLDSIAPVHISLHTQGWKLALARLPMAS